ncbi:MAG: alanine racemase [Gammaproteobacteria bacterium]|nr:alanine racemase [Gammaproteobacteria bacterium]
MTRPARALLDAQALLHNLAQVRSRAPSSKVMAIVKANAYGHGLVWAAQTLRDADALGVASIDEALQLRQAGIRQPITLLEGFFQIDELPLIAQHDLAPVIHHPTQLQALEAANGIAPLTVWLKINTGMNRIGFDVVAAADALARLQRCRQVREVRVMSHFANADDTLDVTTQEQLKRFLAFVNGTDLAGSIANSAGIAGWPASHLDWVRPGIMLYGGSPLAQKSAQDLNLQPVMTLTTALIAVSSRNAGDGIGYGGGYRCPENMPVGVAAIGYGDGYPRRAANGTTVLVNGKRASLIGRVSMDMITIDLRTQPDARVGDPVVLWGVGLAADEVAASAGTISYELFCQVTPRIPRVPL